MDFRRLVGPLFSASAMAAWLSVMSGVGLVVSMRIAVMNRRIERVFWAADFAAIYSVSQVDRLFLGVSCYGGAVYWVD